MFIDKISFNNTENRKKRESEREKELLNLVKYNKLKIIIQKLKQKFKMSESINKKIKLHKLS